MIRNKKTITLMIVAIIVNSCTIRSMNDSETSLEELKRQVIQNKDPDAYDELLTSYLDYDTKESFYYSLVAANRDNNPQAYYDVFSTLESLYSKGLADMDADLRDIAMLYLQKSASLSHYQATDELSKMYIEGKFIAQDTILGRKLKERAEHIYKSK